MMFTEEMLAEDEKRWTARDVVTELGYCGNYMCDRKNMTNLDIRFYAYIMRKAHEMLKEQESCEDAVSRDAVMELTQSYGPATYDMPYGSGDMIIRPEDVKALPSVCPVSVARVMMLEELDDLRGRGRAVWFEDRDAFAKCQDVFFIVASGIHAYFKGETYSMLKMVDGYGKSWRCWTSKPDEKVRAETAWES